MERNLEYFAFASSIDADRDRAIIDGGAFPKSDYLQWWNFLPDEIVELWPTLSRSERMVAKICAKTVERQHWCDVDAASFNDE